MTTWVDARAAKLERQRREARHYSPDRLGPVCRTCGLKVPLALGADLHPTCDPEARALIALAGVANVLCTLAIVGVGVLILLGGIA